MTRRPLSIAGLAAPFVLALASGRAAEPGEPRPFCDEAKCPAGPSCCTDSTFEIELPGGHSVLDLGRDWMPGMRIEAKVFLDARSTGIQGWSYGVRHDPGVLRLERVDEVRYCRPCPDPIVAGKDLEDCGEDPSCKDRREGHGFIAAEVLSLTEDRDMPVGRHILATATYEVLSPPGPGGTRIEITDRLARRDTRPVAVNLTIDGRSRVPRFLTDGHLLGKPVFHRGDPDADGRITVSDAVSIIVFVHLQGPQPPCLEAADWDDGGRVDSADAAALLAWLFSRGTPPAEPGPPGAPCGLDPAGSPADLGCEPVESCT